MPNSHEPQRQHVIDTNITEKISNFFTESQGCLQHGVNWMRGNYCSLEL